MRITRILAPNAGPFTGPGTNSYVVESSGHAVIIDPGPMIGSHLGAIRDAVAALRVVGILVTHHHQDHAPAANPLAAEFSVPSYGFGNFGGFQAISPVADGEGIHVGTKMIEVLHTPGHTPDSLTFAVGSVLFTGDTIKAGSTVVVDDMAAYMATLDRLAARAPEIIYPGHGDRIDDPAAVLADYIAHRRAREEQVLGVLEREPRSAEAIVALVYPELERALMPLATQSTTAHLHKLAAEGRATRSDDGWSRP
ncbi:MAG: MBL fold metallo-hydrolase [Acidimicrobiia bacterium]|nr:MBL fold metallo-hydrolase [Acidimicrobiia bacterium]NNF11331.1 MBL fold metallo-hydrolase [Acidimicrobiia bacterium]